MRVLFFVKFFQLISVKGTFSATCIAPDYSCFHIVDHCFFHVVATFSGSRIYEKQKWLAEQIQEYEARQTEDEKKKKDKEEALRKERRQLRLNGDGRGGAEGTSLWSMMQRSLLVTNKYIHNVDHSHDMNISDVDVRIANIHNRS